MKRFATMAMTCLLCASFVVPVSAAVETNASAWAVEKMQTAYDLGFLTDDMMQHATDDITRKDFCKIVVAFYEKVTGKDVQVPQESPFSDCEDTQVLAAYSLGIIAGVEPGVFRPDATLTREQMCIMLIRTLSACGLDMTQNNAENPFSDTKNLLPSTQQYINMAYHAGLVSGYEDGTFAPKKTLRVQEAVSAFLCAYEYYESVQQSNFEKNRVHLGSKTVSIGATKNAVIGAWGQPTRIDRTVHGLERYVYAQSNTPYVMITFDQDKIVEIFSPVQNMKYCNITGGTQLGNIPEGFTFVERNNTIVCESAQAKAQLILDYENRVSGILLQTADFAQKYPQQTELTTQQRLAIQKELFEIINVKRQEKGLQVLQWEDVLMESAYAHSLDMVEQEYFDYTGKDGRTPFARMQESGMTFHSATEVLVRYQGETPQLYMELMRVAARYGNVFDAQMSRSGIGIADRYGILYMTIDLCDDATA